MNFIQRLMYGRYGVDQLSVFLFALYLVFYLLSAVFHKFSRNIVRRRGENARFMTVAGPAIRWVKLRRTIHRDKDHLYFKCPNCGQQLRAPWGKGKITVNCRNCGVSFEEKT